MAGFHSVGHILLACVPNCRKVCFSPSSALAHYNEQFCHPAEVPGECCTRLAYIHCVIVVVQVRSIPFCGALKSWEYNF